MRLRLLAAALALTSAPLTQAAAPVTVGSKAFTESYLLAEIFAQTLEAQGIEVRRRPGLGATLICYQALAGGAIDVYPEYTGTISQTILEYAVVPDTETLQSALSERGLAMLAPLGFDNTYALAMSEEAAARLGIETISDLAAHPELRFGLSHEFRRRADGWAGLAPLYGLESARTSGIEHGLAYQAIAEGRIDVTDAYSTDGDLQRYRLTVLRDDRAFFPRYLAVPFTRADLAPQARAALGKLAGRLDAATMRALNAEAVVAGRSFEDIAREFLKEQNIATGSASRAPGLWQRLARNTLRHLELTVIAVLLACVAGIAGGVLVHASRRLSRLVLYLSGLLQTIPSIALLALMIPLFGIGVVPAVIALFLYSLLPILRNTITALVTIDPLLRNVARAMGLTRTQQLRHVLLPLAMPNVLAGVKTAAVISIGTATLAAFIGAGGLGEPIVTGLALNDTQLILQGAVPAAVLALATELGFELLERRLVPAHMLSGRLPE